MQKQDEYMAKSMKFKEAVDEMPQMSFSQDFISKIEGKHQTPSLYKDARSTLNIEEEKKLYEEDDNDEF